jgi:hypothetical protein
LVLSLLGAVACDQGDYRQAQTLHEESLALGREIVRSQACHRRGAGGDGGVGVGAGEWQGRTRTL